MESNITKLYNRPQHCVDDNNRYPLFYVEPMLRVCYFDMILIHGDIYKSFLPFIIPFIIHIIVITWIRSTNIAQCWCNEIWPSSCCHIIAVYRLHTDLQFFVMSVIPHITLYQWCTQYIITHQYTEAILLQFLPLDHFFVSYIYLFIYYY